MNGVREWKDLRGGKRFVESMEVRNVQEKRDGLYAEGRVTGQLQDEWTVLRQLSTGRSTEGEVLRK